MMKKMGIAAAFAAGAAVFLGSFLWEADEALPKPEEIRAWVRAGSGTWYGVTGQDGALELIAADRSGTLKTYTDVPDGGGEFLRAAVLEYEETDEALQENVTKYDLLLLTRQEENGEEKCRLERYSPQLEIVSSSEPFVLNGDVLGELLTEGETVYIPVVSGDRKQAVIYETAPEEEIKSVTERSAADGRYFIRAQGDGTEFYAEWDDGTSWRFTEAGSEEIESFGSRAEDAPQTLEGLLAVIQKDSWILAGKAFLVLLIFSAAVFLIYECLIGKSYLARRLAIQEAVLIAVLAVLLWGPQKFMEEARRQDARSLAGAALFDLQKELADASALTVSPGGLTESESYRKSYEELLTAGQGAVLQDAFEGIYLVSCLDGQCMVMMGDDTACGTPLFEVLGTEAEMLVNSAKDSNKEQYDAKAHLMALPAGEGISQSVFLAGKLNVNGGFYANTDWLERMLPAAVIIWAGVTVILGAMLFMEAGNMKRISREMHDVSVGRRLKVQRGGTADKDTQRMWNALEDYSKNRQRFRYQQSGVLRAYMRFLPDGVEEIRDGEGMEELSAGDSMQVSGVLGSVKLRFAGANPQESIKQRSLLLETLFACQEDDAAILLPESGNADSLWAMFTGNPDAAIHFGLHALMELKNSRNLPQTEPVCFLHYTEYFYGVVGSDQKLFACLESQEGQRLLAVRDQLAAIQVRMAVTESVRIRITPETSLRCIGYLSLKKESKQKIYEVLDVYPQQKRQALENGKGKFKEALHLYYKSDFYFARNLFTELLKSCPQDGAAKWYLFRCERMLGGTAPEDFSYELFAEE